MKPTQVILLALPLYLLAPSLCAQERDIEALVSACAQCHGPSGEAGVPGWPPLVQMSKEEIAEKLRGHRAGRVPDSTMSRVAIDLSDAEIDAIAEHYATQEKR